MRDSFVGELDQIPNQTIDMKNRRPRKGKKKREKR